MMTYDNFYEPSLRAYNNGTYKESACSKKACFANKASCFQLNSYSLKRIDLKNIWGKLVMHFAV